MNQPTLQITGPHPLWFNIQDIVRPMIILLLLCGLFSPLTVFAGDIFKGETLYKTHCELCHGAGGRPATPDAPNFSRGNRLIQSDISLSKSIRFGKNSMPSFDGVLSEKEIFDVISYLRTLY